MRDFRESDLSFASAYWRFIPIELPRLRADTMRSLILKDGETFIFGSQAQAFPSQCLFKSQF